MMIVRHKVRDYGQWRPVLDRHAEMQRAAGLTNPRVYHSADSNKIEIVVVFDTEDTKKAKDFAASGDLKDARLRAKTLLFLRSTPTLLVSYATSLSPMPVSMRSTQDHGEMSVSP